jgi:hypothetical protein
VCLALLVFYGRFFDVYLTQYRIPAIVLGITALASLFSGLLLQSPVLTLQHAIFA